MIDATTGAFTAHRCRHLAWSPPLQAQRLAVPVIGFLSTAAPASRGGEQLAAFHSGLRQVGYTEGQNVRIEYRWANDDYALLRAQAKELVDLQVAVIVAAGGHVSALAAHDATKEIPIAFTTVTDPVHSGLLSARIGPSPGIPKPEMRQEMKCGGLGPAIDCLNADC